jgi:hypothetical protein
MPTRCSRTSPALFNKSASHQATQRPAEAQSRPRHTRAPALPGLLLSDRASPSVNSSQFDQYGAHDLFRSPFAIRHAADVRGVYAQLCRNSGIHAHVKPVRLEQGFGTGLTHKRTFLEVFCHGRCQIKDTIAGQVPTERRPMREKTGAQPGGFTVGCRGASWREGK